MFAIYLFYGLAFFTLGLAALLESRRGSALLLGRQLPWLAAFGLTHSLVEWSELLLLTQPGGLARQLIDTAHLLLLPLSALLLIRFGVGLISEAGPLPKWLLLFPFVLIVPVVLVVAYGLVVTLTEPDIGIASDIWSRYLLFIPGGLLATAGFLRQSSEPSLVQSQTVRSMMRGAAAAFFAYAVFAGLVVPAAPYGLAPWINYAAVQDVSGVPIQVWRTFAAVGVTFFVVRALDIFELERKQRLDAMAARSRQAEATLRESELRFRNIFEHAPIGMDIVTADGRPMRANRALQEMLGYDEAELTKMLFADYTHPDDRALSLQLSQEVRDGLRQSFQLEKRYRRKDGADVHARVTVFGVNDARDNFSHFIAMVEDVTERKRAEEELARERAQAQEAQLQVQKEARAVAERWTNTLVAIGRRIAQMEGVDTVLLHILGQAQKLLGADTVSLGLLEADGRTLALKYQATGARSYVVNPALPVDSAGLAQILRSGRSYRFPNCETLRDLTWYCPTVAREVKAAVVVPLQFDGQVIGGLWAARFVPEPFTSVQRFGLESLADQAVIALQHASMAARLQSVATLEERSRIAREMHDGLAQVLGYMSIQMQTIEAYARQELTEDVLREIGRTRENIRLAQAEVRDNILSLRTTLSGDVGLVAGLQEYVEEFGVQAGTEAVFVNELNGAPQLSPLAEVQLVRIVQEALTNVRKHAAARRVQVRLARANGDLLLSVQDDGAGFDTTPGNRHFGLQTMAERATSVGGCLEVRSAPQQGTEVRLRMPLVYESVNDGQ